MLKIRLLYTQELSLKLSEKSFETQYIKNAYYSNCIKLTARYYQQYLTVSIRSNVVKYSIMVSSENVVTKRLIYGVFLSLKLVYEYSNTIMMQYAFKWIYFVVLNNVYVAFTYDVQETYL